MAATPVLELAVLKAEAWPRGDSRYRVFTLKWPDAEPLLIIDAREDEPHIMVAHRWSDLGDPKWQIIETDRQDNGRLRLVCPASNRNCDKLYLRDGHFASWQWHRLFHDSQRGQKRSRVRVKQEEKIEERKQREKLAYALMGRHDLDEMLSMLAQARAAADFSKK